MKFGDGIGGFDKFGDLGVLRHGVELGGGV